MPSDTSSHLDASATAAPVEGAPTADDGLWAVVVVHGVGESGAGRTLNAFTRTFLAHNPHARQIRPPEVRLLWTPEDVLPAKGAPLQAPDAQGYVPFRDRFPMHLRTLTFETTRSGTPRRAIFAEVYWADLSLAGEGMWHLLLQLFTIIFHLRFLPDRIADFEPKAPREYNPTRLARWLRLFLFVSSWLLCGPIAGLAATVLYLVVWRWLIGLASSWGLLRRAGWEISIVLPSIVGILLACVLELARRRNRWGSPWKLTIGWLLGWNVLVICAGIYALARTLHPIPFAADEHPIAGHIHSLLCLSRWSMCLITAVLMLAVGAWLAAWVRDRRARPALTAALGIALLQAGMWVIIVPLLQRFALNKLAPEILDSDGTLQTGNSLLVLNLFAAGVVLGIVNLVWLVRRVMAWRHATRLPRLLVNAWVFRTLIALFVLHGVLFLYGALTDSWPVHDLFAPYFEPLYVVVSYIVLVCASLSVGQKHVRSGLHILMDVVSHFYYRPMRVPWPCGPPHRMVISRFAVQMRIEARMRRVLQEVLSESDVTHLTIVSHSQGTVTAVDVLWLDWTSRLLAGKEVRLVTMGSPFTHLYQTYFPYRYAALFDQGSFNTRSWGALQRTVTHWLNVFRVDDFVGTQIDGDGSFPTNIPLRAGGHIRYWQADDVMETVRDQLPG